MGFENCVVCGKETYIRRDTPIDLRNNYIIGVGQLCEECAIKLKEDLGDRRRYDRQIKL